MRKLIFIAEMADENVSDKGDKQEEKTKKSRKRKREEDEWKAIAVFTNNRLQKTVKEAINHKDSKPDDPDIQLAIKILLTDKLAKRFGQ